MYWVFRIKLIDKKIENQKKHLNLKIKIILNSREKLCFECQIVFVQHMIRFTDIWYDEMICLFYKKE
jgi:hypothetical protein